MRSVTYYGQDVDGFDYIGTVDYMVPVTEGMDVAHTVAELHRGLGRNIFLYLFKKEGDETDGNW